jgi:site-specific recombinase XerD
MSSLYRRNEVYWLSFRYHGKAYSISLGTRDRSTAIYLKAKKDQELTEGRYIIRQDIPCSEVLKEYMDASQHRKAKKTNDDDESRIETFLEWSGITKVNQITEKRLQEYLNHRINDDNLTLSSANRLISTFKAWLNFAVRRKIIFENPIRYFKGYNPGEKHPKFLPLGKIPKIFEVADGKRPYYPIRTGLYTGMREKEVYCLEWPDLDFEDGTITVRRGGAVITKSKKERVIPLPAKLKADLLPLKKNSGVCFDFTNFRHEFPKIMEAAGLKGVTFQWFRHTYASHLIMNGVDLYTVSQLLGHSSVKVTEKHYAHLTKDHKKASVEKLPY